ncbi:MAG: hypothetical protein EPO07_08780, partial [Verrucomicrobia bacterium]
FEPRYRRMLADVLESHRMFAVAMRRPDTKRELPLPVAGMGLVRVSVQHRDGTSHLVLHGVLRVELEQAVRYKPYRVHRVRPLVTPPCNEGITEALMADMRQLLRERLKVGMPFPFPFMSSPKQLKPGDEPPVSAEKVLNYLDSLTDPDSAADLVSCAVLTGGEDRQTILEAVDMETRFRHLIRFLRRDLEAYRKQKQNE